MGQDEEACRYLLHLFWQRASLFHSSGALDVFSCVHVKTFLPCWELTPLHLKWLLHSFLCEFPCLNFKKVTFSKQTLKNYIFKTWIVTRIIYRNCFIFILAIFFYILRWIFITVKVHFLHQEKLWQHFIHLCIFHLRFIRSYNLLYTTIFFRWLGVIFNRYALH